MPRSIYAFTADCFTSSGITTYPSKEHTGPGSPEDHFCHSRTNCSVLGNFNTTSHWSMYVYSRLDKCKETENRAAIVELMLFKEGI